MYLWYNISHKSIHQASQYYSSSRGGRRVFRQTEMARKTAGKTEINQKPTAAGNGN